MNDSIKNFVSGIVLFFLGRAMKSCYRLDDEVRKELNSFEEGHKIKLGASPSGPAMVFWRKNGKIEFITGKKAVNSDSNLYFEFKNASAGFLVLTGQIGIDVAYCQHRMLVYGDIYSAMSIVRVMSKVENYLFPSFITNKILKRKPKKEVSSLRVYTAVLFGI